MRSGSIGFQNLEMRSMKLLRLFWTFYQGFILFSTIITTWCIIQFWKYGFHIFAVLFWLKIATLGLTFYFINKYKSKEFAYYQNLGVSKRLLWTTTLIFDFALLLVLLILISNFK